MLRRFLSELLETGRVLVARPGTGDARGDDDDGADAVLAELDARARAELAGTAPPLDLPAARFGARALHRGCQLLAFRDVPAEVVRELLFGTPPPPRSPASVYSADLALQHLPELWALAAGLARDDPLVACLLELGTAWPLSSVGVPGVPGELDLKAITSDPCLLRLYADRVLARRDVARLGDARVREAVRVALGAHPELAPQVARALEEGYAG